MSFPTNSYGAPLSSEEEYIDAKEYENLCAAEVPPPVRVISPGITLPGGEIIGAMSDSDNAEVYSFAPGSVLGKLVKWRKERERRYNSETRKNTYRDEQSERAARIEYLRRRAELELPLFEGE